MISMDFCEKMSHATTRLDVFRRAVVSTPAIFFPRKPVPQLHYYRKLLFACPMIEIRWDQGKNQLEIMVHVLDLIENYLNTGGERGNLNVCVLG